LEEPVGVYLSLLYSDNIILLYVYKSVARLSEYDINYIGGHLHIHISAAREAFKNQKG
jgi:hypothetical protein